MPGPTTDLIRLVVTGCCGRMGSLIAEEAAKDPSRFELMGAIEHNGHPQIGKSLPTKPSVKVTDNLAQVLRQANLLIEFTTPEASISNAQTASQAQVPMIIGTTGFTPEQMAQLRQAARQIPIFWSPNMSIGIVMLRKTLAELFELYRKFGLEQQASIRISETHHVRKKDKPSGTAKLLAEEIRKVTGRAIPDGKIEAKREGEVVGIHSVTFHSGSEEITLQHEALDRRVFAQGALVVARYFSKICTRPGLYGMDDFLR